MRIGSLFSGYGGLDQAVANVTGATTAWVSDIDKGACKILAHRYPDVPNLGDISAVDWSQVEPVDILTGGFPCQDVSHAGKRAGLKDGTRSGLWSVMAEGIDQLRPELVVIENVRGLLSAEAHSDVEPCPVCLGDGPGVHLRALGAVLADLAELGYDAQWHGLRAADVGAPHGRFRVFVVAYPRGEAGEFGTGLRASESTRDGRGQPARSGRPALALLPTPGATDGTKGGPNQRGSSGDLMLPSAVLLPTPMVGSTSPAAHGQISGDFRRRMDEALALMPTPSVADIQGGRKGRSGDRSDELLLNGLAAEQRFGQYAPAIERWEHVLSRPAPAPTEPTGKNGAHRLSPAFVEWMMGLAAGWITDVPGITRNEALKACGNGVVPQQAEAALRHMLGQLVMAA